MEKLEIATAIVLQFFINNHGASRQEVADKLGITSSALSKILNFQQGVPFVLVHVFCRSWDVDIGEFSRLVQQVSEDNERLEALDRCRTDKRLLRTARESLVSNLDARR